MPTIILSALDSGSAVMAAAESVKYRVNSLDSFVCTQSWIAAACALTFSLA